MTNPSNLPTSALSEFLATVEVVRTHRPGLTPTIAVAEALSDLLGIDPATDPASTGWELLAAAALHAHHHELTPSEVAIDAALAWIDTQRALHPTPRTHRGQAIPVA